MDSKALVLMYHRIATLSNDPWELAVSPEHFEQQLQVLSGKNIIALDQLLLQLKKGKLKRNAVAVTFDDGYIDNYTVAEPLLEKYRIPATFFIPSKNIGSQNEYWWDELELIIHDKSITPRDLRLAADGESISVSKDEFDNRNSLYVRIWEKLLPLPFEKQQKMLTELRSVLNVSKSSRSNYCCMNQGQLQKMSESDSFSLQAHTVTHPALAHQPLQVQEYELKQGWKDISNITGDSIGTIAYPYGNYNDDTISIAKKYFEAGFTTEPKLIFRGSDPFRLGRFKVNDWDGDTFESKLNQWFKG